MATLTIRNLDSAIVQKLKQRAAEHHRSMEAEVREMLRAQVGRNELAREWLESVAGLSEPELRLPARSAPREISFS